MKRIKSIAANPKFLYIYLCFSSDLLEKTFLYFVQGAENQGIYYITAQQGGEMRKHQFLLYIQAANLQRPADSAIMTGFSEQ